MLLIMVVIIDSFWVRAERHFGCWHRGRHHWDRCWTAWPALCHSPSSCPVHPRQEKRLIWKCLSQCPNEASVISWMFWVHNIRPVRAIYRNVDITHYTTVLSLEVPTSNMIEWNAEIYVLRGLCFVTRVFSEVSCLSSSDWERLRATDQLKSPLSSCLTGLNNLHKHDAREVEERENEVKEHKWRWREGERRRPLSLDVPMIELS